MSATDTYARSFKMPLWRCVKRADDYAAISACQQALTQALDMELADEERLQQASSLPLSPKGTFWKQYGDLAGRPYKKDGYPINKGNKAKMYRMVEEQVRHQLLAKHETVLIDGICAKHGYDFMRSEEIMDACHETGLYPTFWQLNRLLRDCGSQTQVLPSHIEAQIDWTTQDNVPIKMTYRDDVIIAKADYNGVWVEIKIPVPDYIKEQVQSFSKPVIYLDAVTQELWVRVAYDMYGVDNETISDRILGVDLGQVKAFVGAVLQGDGSWEGELRPSRELDRVMLKHRRLHDDCAAVRRKLNRVESLLGLDYRDGESDEDRKARGERSRVLLGDGLYSRLLVRRDRVRGDWLCKKRKLSRLKQHEAYLYARDVVSHAVECGVVEIHVEDLRPFAGVSGQWDYRLVFDCIAQEAELFGIPVYLVRAQGSSSECPFDGSQGVILRNRLVRFEDGSLLDRDCVGALNVCVRPRRCRVGGKGRKSRYSQNVRKAKESKKVTKVKKAKEKQVNSGVTDVVVSSDGVSSQVEGESEPVVRPVWGKRVGASVRRPSKGFYPRVLISSAAGASSSVVLPARRTNLQYSPAESKTGTVSQEECLSQTTHLQTVIEKSQDLSVTTVKV